VGGLPLEELFMSSKSASAYQIFPTKTKLTIVPFHASDPAQSALKGNDAGIDNLK
jgi:hypothetical protein